MKRRMMGHVWVHARYPLSLYIPSVDAARVYEQETAKTHLFEARAPPKVSMCQQGAMCTSQRVQP
jgi:hypothetical protein